LAKNKPNWDFVAVDINNQACQVAQANAALHEVKNIRFMVSDLFSGLKDKKFNIIVSNPPYVSLSEYRNLSPAVKKQPFQSLVATQDGYFFYRQIFQQASTFLFCSFLLVVEIGYQQKEKILKLIMRSFPLAQVRVFSDRNSHSRVMVIYQKEKAW
jgi:release factor glutamine methyltransferase